MEACQICGKEAVGEGYVEGAKVPLCHTCAQYGNRLQLYQQFQPPKPAPKVHLKDEQHFIENAGSTIKSARELKGWDRTQLGKRLFISETDIRAFEDDRRFPTPAQVEKLEHELGIKLVVTDKPEERDKGGNEKTQPREGTPGRTPGPRKPEEFTLGDIVTIKKK
ncbi:TIGR00270 family protein [Candidatus Micrarchaeota archaeon]|nr:TIGR00270 family protein [Candidatus Micrarchaeota archaeon]